MAEDIAQLRAARDEYHIGLDLLLFELKSTPDTKYEWDQTAMQNAVRNASLCVKKDPQTNEELLDGIIATFLITFSVTQSVIFEFATENVDEDLAKIIAESEMKLYQWIRLMLQNDDVVKDKPSILTQRAMVYWCYLKFSIGTPQNSTIDDIHTSIGILMEIDSFITSARKNGVTLASPSHHCGILISAVNHNLLIQGRVKTQKECEQCLEKIIMLTDRIQEIMMSPDLASHLMFDASKTKITQYKITQSIQLLIGLNVKQANFLEALKLVSTLTEYMDEDQIQLERCRMISKIVTAIMRYIDLKSQGISIPIIQNLVNEHITNMKERLLAPTTGDTSIDLDLEISGLQEKITEAVEFIERIDKMSDLEREELLDLVALFNYSNLAKSQQDFSDIIPVGHLQQLLLNEFKKIHPPDAQEIDDFTAIAFNACDQIKDDIACVLSTPNIRLTPAELQVMISMINMTIKNCFSLSVLPESEDKDEERYSLFLKMIGKAMHCRLFKINKGALVKFPHILHEYILFWIIAAERHIDKHGTGYENWVSRANELQRIYSTLDASSKVDVGVQDSILRSIYSIVESPIILGAQTYKFL